MFTEVVNSDTRNYFINCFFSHKCFAQSASLFKTEVFGPKGGTTTISQLYFTTKNLVNSLLWRVNFRSIFYTHTQFNRLMWDLTEMKNNGLKYLSFVSMVFLQLEKTRHSFDECVHPLLPHITTALPIAANLQFSIHDACCDLMARAAWRCAEVVAFIHLPSTPSVGCWP